MKFVFATVSLGVAVMLSFSACSKKKDPLQDLEKASAELEKPATAPSEQPVATAAAPTSASTQEIPAVPPSQQMRSAIADYKAGKMEDAVTRLQLLRSMTSITPQQRMTLQDSIASVMTEVYALAAKGDKRAIAAVARYEQMQTNRR